jgi:hypothetical protein
MEKDRLKTNLKGAGRKRKFSDTELMEIVDSFLINEYKGGIKCSKEN